MFSGARATPLTVLDSLGLRAALLTLPFPWGGFSSGCCAREIMEWEF